MGIRDKIKANHGYIDDTMLQDTRNEFGGDFEVVVKKGSGNRNRIALKDFERFGTQTESQGDYIREVFISADDYRKMF